MKFAPIIALLLPLILLPVFASAHGGGLSLEATSSGYFIDVDYADGSVFADESGRFDFKLYQDADRTKTVPFTQAWVRIVRKSDLPEGTTVFSGWIAKAALGSTGFSIALPESGAHELIVRFDNEKGEIAEATIPFTVESPASDGPDMRDFFYGTLAGIAIGLGALAIMRIKKAP